MLPREYVIEVLDTNLKPIAQPVAFVPIDNAGNWLEYSQKLSNWGQARFRIATKDPLWKANGDIMKSHANHIRIYRTGSIVWQGVIVKRPHRTRQFVEVVAYEYLYILKRVLIRHDPANGAGAENYRNFNSGTLANVVRTLVAEAQADGPGVLSNLTIGTVDNFNFPANFTDINNANIGGQPWVFSNNFFVKFDYRTNWYAINQLALYAVADYEITSGFQFNFRTKIGDNHPELVFEYSQYGQIRDYDAPEDGEQQANYLLGIAADNDFNILKADVTDQASINTYGKWADVAAYGDVKNINLLRSRLAEELLLSSTPNQEVNATLNSNAYPLGQYKVGDTVTLKIDDHVTQVNELRRIVGITVKAHNTGTEEIRLVTNKPRAT